MQNKSTSRRTLLDFQVQTWLIDASFAKLVAVIYFLNIFATMFGKLRDKWQVNGWQLLLVITTFALGGSLCGYVGRKLMALLPIGHPVWWTITYIILVTLVWPLCVLLISIPLGQFSFFKKYLRRLANRLFGKKTDNRGDADNKNKL